jgi:periplasmic protein TonB
MPPCSIRHAPPELSQRAVVLVAIGILHALAIYLVVSESSRRYGRLDGSVIEAKVIPAEREVLTPPSLPPVIFPASRPVDYPAPQVAIDLPAEQVPTSPVMDTPHMVERPLPVSATGAPGGDPGPVLRPQPIAGPEGVNRYPRASLKAKESGTVAMIICVSPQGNVSSVEVARSSGFPRLDAAALSIASEYRFKPATRYGTPVAACAHYNIIFKVI